jgi:nitrite reductase/ring-hydroxylating ferredoxin subunit
VKGTQIALFNINGEFYALGNTCTHDSGSLAERETSGHEVICPLHGAKFDIRERSLVRKRRIGRVPERSGILLSGATDRRQLHSGS